jgi:AraC family transcriptional regulator
MREGTPESYQERILRVLVHIQTHLDDPLTLDDLASVACFSPYHFHRIFRGLVGEPVAEHLRRLRLERAAGRLKFTDHQVIDIALDAEYDSHEAFTRAFRANFGRAPSIHRAEASAAITAPPEGGPWIEVQVENVPATRVAFTRHVGGYADVGATWARLFSWIIPRGLFRADTRTIGICHDDPEVAPLDKCRYDAAVTVLPDAVGEGDVGIQEIPARKYAVAMHKGAYGGLSETYARMCGEWLPWSGYELAAAPSLEMYLNNPQMTAEENLLTRVCLPLV